MKTNPEGLTFEEWCCAAGVARFRDGVFLSYTSSDTVWRQAVPGKPFVWHKGARYRVVRRTTRHYSLKVRRAWLTGEDPSEWGVT